MLAINVGILIGVNLALAVSVQRLNVPDLVVIDQLNQQQMRASSHGIAAQKLAYQHMGTNNQPEAASLVNEQPQITFECLVSFDKKKDKNLIVKWHHDERIEPIYQWIPELNKRSIAPQYRPFIAPIASNTSADFSANNQHLANATGAPVQMLEAGFKLVRPTKELGGEYC